jgi:hypothetical protein
MPGWTGIKIATANVLLQAINVKITHNEKEKNYISYHPNKPEEFIRRNSVTELFIEVMTNWVTLK